jgi:hypothetical protein
VRHTPESRAKIAASNSARWDDPAKRAAVSAATKARMADPEVRQRIKDGMRKGLVELDELKALRAAWAATRPAARARFIIELLSPASSASVPSAEGEVG